MNTLQNAGPGRRFLSKPFSGASLLDSVAEALAPSPGRTGAD